MSDFIYSNCGMEKDSLKRKLCSIYHHDLPEVDEYRGGWGTLAISRNLYNGFQVYEDFNYLCAVIGGPVLFFRDNLFLTGDSETEGTQAVFERWKKGEMRWDEDLSGPFTVVIIDKRTSEILCVTDIMSFIPVFVYQDSSLLMLATHSDAIAVAANQQFELDMASKVDAVLFGVVTYPYTVYRNVYQIPPASIHTKHADAATLQSVSYWVPTEPANYKSLNKAAEDLTSELEIYIAKVTEGMPYIAQFISGGEDSRLLSGLLQTVAEREAFIYLDSMNREGVRAKKAADAYGVRFNLLTRKKNHYLEILPEAADLIGDGAEFLHAHTLKFSKESKLLEFPAVFGGFYSDSLLKGDCIVKIKGIGRLPFIPQMKSLYQSRGDNISNSAFTEEILQEVTNRRRAHLDFVRSFRKQTAEEWFELWPSSMNYALPNIHVNRRLFKSYEPFMANGVVKISAAVPQQWMLNRRLFHRAAKPFFKQTKWLFHSDGRLPYFSWRINSFIQMGVWGYQQLSKRLGLDKEYQGSWAEWEFLIKSGEFQKHIDKYSEGSKLMAVVFNEKDINKVFNNKELTHTQRVNLLQALYSNQKRMQAIHNGGLIQSGNENFTLETR